MPITHQISSNPLAPLVPGGDIIGKLSGLIGQAQALVTAAAGLPGIQAIGSQIAALSGAVTTAGGAAGINTTSISAQLSSLGSQMSTSNMAGMAGLLTSLNAQLSSLTSLLNPAGGLASVLHSHILEAGSGITHSAFGGQHVVNLASAGISLLSSVTVSHTAPKLPHNGLTLVSDALQVSKGVFGAGFSLISDRRLKENINEHPSVLQDVLKLRLKTFDVKSVDWETKEVNDLPARPSIGLIAQEVQELFPLLVRDDGFLTLEESKIGMLVLGAFQEFVAETRAEIRFLKNEIAMLKRQR